MKSEKKLGIIIIAIVVILSILFATNCFLSLIDKPYGLGLYARGAVISMKVDDYLEEKYPDDDFKFKSLDVSRGEWFELFKPTGYRFTFSVKGSDETVGVTCTLEGNDLSDSFRYQKYEDEAIETIISCLDNYFGEGNYCCYIDDYRYYSDDSKNDEGLYDYIFNQIEGLRVIVSSNFKYDEDKLTQDIINNMDSVIDTTKCSVYIDILFDKADDVDIPKHKEIDSTIFFNFDKFNYWDKELIIENKCIDSFDYYNPEYTKPTCKWKSNDKESKKHKTKNKFLNGERLELVIDGNTFYLDDGVTASSLAESPNVMIVGAFKDFYYMKPYTDRTEELLVKHGDTEKCRMDISLINDTNDLLKFYSAKVSSISIGDIYELNAEMYSTVSLCGLKIGDDFDIDEITKRFGPYESCGKNKLEDDVYVFVDGTETADDFLDSYTSSFYIYVRNGKIKQISCKYIPTSEYIKSDYETYNSKGNKIYEDGEEK